MATDDQMLHAAQRRRALLEVVRRFIETRGYPPTLTELAEVTGVTRETTVVDLRTLEAAQLVEVDKGVTRGIRLVGFDVVLVPRAPALDPVAV